MNCTCDPTRGREAKKGHPGICGKCQGRFQANNKLIEKKREEELDESELVDAETWLQARIYKPKERVRAINKDGKWYVYDGVRVHEFTEAQFNDTYELASQTPVLRKIDNKTTVHEYH